MDTLEAAGERLVAHPAGAPAPLDELRARVRHRQRRRAGRRAGAAVLAIVVATGAGVLAFGEDGSRDLVTVAPPATAPDSVAGDGTGSDELPSPPLGVRGDAAVTWTGEELVVWGGHVEARNMGLPGQDRSYADGAAYNPATRSWRVMSPAPLPASPTRAIAVTVDAGVVIARGTATALWDPITDSWRELEAAPGPVESLVSTGGAALSHSAKLDPLTGTWTPLADPPSRLERPATAWTGSELIVIGGPGTPFTTAAAFAYDPTTDSWRTVSDPPSDLTAAALAADWDGQRVVVVNYDMRAATYDPESDSWSDLPAVPARFSEWYPSVRSAGTTTLAFMAHAVVLLTQDDTWIPLPYGVLSPGRAVTTGSGELLVWGLDSQADKNVLTKIDPGALATSPQAVQIGLATVALPTGYEVLGTSIAAAASASEGINMDLTGDGAQCTISASYQGMEVPGPGQPVTETLENGDAPIEWRRSADERIWHAAGTSSDQLVIMCSTGDAARALAAATSFPAQ